MYKETVMPSGKVLVAAFLLNIPKTPKSVDSVMNVISKFTPEEWECMKHYISTGSFVNFQ